jgi:type I restriction enzyme S subunit
MSRIDDLLSAHCPNGVPFVELSTVAETVSGLASKTKSDFADGNARFVSYKNVFANLAVNQGADDFVKVGPNERQNALRIGDVIFTGSSETADEVGMSSVVLTEPIEPLYLNSFCFALRFHDAGLFLPGFSKYLFRGDSVRALIQKSASGVTRINISKQRFMKIKIPVPPIEVQREIVRSLDLFTELEAELEAELRLRRQQYGHYRDSLLSFREAGGVRWLPMGELGTWTGGITPSKSEPRYWESGTIPWLASMDISATAGREIRGRVTQAALDETPLRLVQAPTVAVVMRSNVLRRFLPIGFVDVDTTVNQDMRVLSPREDVHPRFIYQAILAASEAIRSACVRTDGSMAAVDSKAFFEWLVPVPPLDEQGRIVETLDGLDALVNDLSIGLPAELNARRQQYEYYRDKLLTFKEAA